jgi:hypothetical protein
MFAARIAALKASANLTGIDFVAVEPDQTDASGPFSPQPRDADRP